MWAASRGDENAVSTLLDFGADPRMVNYQNQSVLLHAVQSDSVACTTLILEANVVVDYPGSRTPLMGASLGSDNPRMIETLLVRMDAQSERRAGHLCITHAATIESKTLVACLITERTWNDAVPRGEPPSSTPSSKTATP